VKHTQGPWGIYIPEHDVTAWDEEAQQTVTVAIMADDELKETREANARLIAAAPDLLECLQNLVHRGLIVNDNDHYEECIEAIAKATGKEVTP
tara:strand:- start:27 stop:305 length:279 start_codon:yes stop_codon:yes gene_type:complete